jgi:UDP-glucuronate 4-epimerase
MLPRTILLTGGAGFIGSHLSEKLLEAGHELWCIDNLDPYYDPAIKRQNLAVAVRNERFHFIEADLTADPGTWQGPLRDARFDAIIHLAARAGVRPSIRQAADYYRTNVLGTLSLLDYAITNGIPKFLFASSSSVYGNNPRVPWAEDDRSGNPISPYASSKLAAEELGRVYAHLYGIRFLAMRLFTVYGPRQRPDLAIHKFYELIDADKPITLYGNGQTRRDYTYVSDIVDGFIAAMEYAGEERVFNLGDSSPVELTALIRAIESAMGKQARILHGPAQEGDVDQTYANISKAAEHLHYQPRVGLEQGLAAFVQWKKESHKALATQP